MLRVGPKLHLGIQRQARAQNLSLNQFILNAIQNSSVEAPVVKALCDTFGASLLGVVLFGSVVRGEERADSDIDLLIVLDQSRAIDRSLYQIWDAQIEPAVDSRYSPQFSHFPDPVKGPSSLWLEVALEGDVLFDNPERSLKKCLQKIRAQIAEGRYIRKISHGHPYWVRQEEKPHAE